MRKAVCRPIEAEVLDDHNQSEATNLKKILGVITPNINTFAIMSLYNLNIGNRLFMLAELQLRKSDNYAHIRLRRYDFLKFIEYIKGKGLINASSLKQDNISPHFLSEYDDKYTVHNNDVRVESSLVSGIDVFKYRGALFFIPPGKGGESYDVFGAGPNAKKIAKRLMRDVILATSPYKIEKDTPLIISSLDNDDYNNKSIILGKKFEHIILKDKQMFIDEIDGWIATKSIYEKFDRIHKFGILLHGKPGTGKTTLIRMLATYYNANIISIDANKVTENFIGNLHNNISRTNLNIIIFEEVESLFESHTVKTLKKNSIIGTKEIEDNYGSSRSRRLLLNLLDGMDSINNTIFIATTNYYENLDEAFIRDGRFDLKVEMNFFEEDMAIEMCKMYNMDIHKIIDVTKDLPICPATLERNIMKYMIDNKINMG